MNRNTAVPEPIENPYAEHDNVSVKRLALQGHRAAARELAKRSAGCLTVTSFLETMLTAEERKRLSGAQFNVLDDAFEEQWRAANRPTVELVNVSVKSNL